jgi:hypothetical protein
MRFRVVDLHRPSWRMSEVSGHGDSASTTPGGGSVTSRHGTDE